MAPHVHGPPVARDSLERVRHRLLSDLHVGRLAPGDRVPSVRRLADQTGLNRKTVHRAYSRLAEEGLLEPRPGSGTFVAETLDAAPAPIAALLDVAESWGTRARALGLRPERLTRFLEYFHGDALARVPMVVTECNREQSGLIERDLAETFGAAVESIPLARLPRMRARLARRAVVTTDCHHAEVVDRLRGTAARVYRVAFDRDFPSNIAEAARRGAVAMVVSDATFAPVFLRLLRAMRVPRSTVARVRISTAARSADGAIDLAGTDVVYVSPLVDERFVSRLAGRPIRAVWRLDAGSRKRLRTALAVDLAMDRLMIGGPPGLAERTG